MAEGEFVNREKLWGTSVRFEVYEDALRFSRSRMERSPGFGDKGGRVHNVRRGCVVYEMSEQWREMRDENDAIFAGMGLVCDDWGGRSHRSRGENILNYLILFYFITVN